MKCIINGQIILPTEVKTGMAIIFDEKIESIVKADEIDLSKYEVIDAKGNYVAPGLVDIHIHGYMGCDTSDGDANGIRKMSAGLVKNGVTSFCPTTMTVSQEEIEKAFNDAREVKAEGAKNGAKVLGINCEGPFINPSKKGAQAEDHIKKPDADFIINNADIIKVYTIAPEMEGGLECVEKVYNDGRVVASIGHTGASFDEANAGIKKGVRHTTHLFNAMTSLMHRNPGVVGAVLSDDNVSVELIADTFHINPGLYKMVAKLKGDKLCLITDCMRAGGMPDGDYTLGGQPVKKVGIQCLMPDGTIAGSVLDLNKGVKNFYEHSGVSLPEAFAAASLNPAKAIGEDDKIGSLEVGKLADIIIVDNDFNIIKTIIGGLEK